MINGAPLAAMLAEFEHLLALCGAVIWGSAVGLPIRRAIIRRWAKRG